MDCRILNIVPADYSFLAFLFQVKHCLYIDGIAIVANELIDELKELLIEGLHLEEIESDDIDADAPLFGEGLGLDSIDALEIAVLLDKKYGVKIVSGDDRNPTIFASLNALAEFVASNRKS